MASKFVVSEDVKALIENIIAKNNLKEVSDIKYQPGSEVGDGYISKTVSVEIVNGNDQFQVFLKCASNMKSSDAMPVDKLYRNEIYFYDIIYPAYLKFLEERSIKSGLEFIPKCYGTASGNIVALENLRGKNFTLFDRTKLMNEVHIVMVFKAFAKFHAISYAYKDQEREKYDQLIEAIYDYYKDTGEPFEDYLTKTVNEFKAENLDPEEDKYLLDKCDGLAEKLAAILTSASKNLNKYSILTQGDCHCMNMMFAYENENQTNPSDIRLIDWQVIREASPVYDLSYFFYPVASNEALDRLHYYLRIYHDELREWIKVLGSDPDVLYPLEVFMDEWRKFCKFGFANAFIVVRAMLSSKDEVFNMEEFDFENKDAVKNIELPKLAKEEEVQQRLKSLLVHMVKNDFI